jgi:NADPH:quinone reductase-like Zn-dependent oxidoreductase
MKAARINAYGDAGAVTIHGDVPRPTAGGGRVLVAVHAASLNPADSAIRAGYMHAMAPLQFPATLGLDIAGIIAEADPGAAGFKAGDKVYGSASVFAGATGAFAEYAAVPAAILARAPKTSSFTEAAALPLAGICALQAIEELLKVHKGTRILVHGGSGGIGTFAVQMAKHLGAHVAATARGSAVSYVQSLGADEVIDFEKSSFPDILHDYDAVLDTRGGDVYAGSFSVLKKGGMIVSLAAPPDAERAAKHQVTALPLQAGVTADRLDRLARLVDEGTVTVHLHGVYPFEKIREAFIARESGKVLGKIVLQIRKDA